VSRPLEIIAEEYLRNRRAYGELVGTLYPGIVYNHLLRLREEYQEAGGDPFDLPWIQPPTNDGHAPVIT